VTTAPDPTFLSTAIEAVVRAGDLQIAKFGTGVHVRKKGAIDLVTDVDVEVETMFRAMIAERFPDHDVLAEELGAHANRGARHRWVFDPLDGTTNFAHNYPFFGVSIGVEVEGALTAGVVFDPVRDELFAAALGAGATMNGAPIRVSTIDRVERALLVTGFAYDVREHPERYVPLFQEFLVRAQGIRRDGSAALNLCYLAMGRFDGFWESHLSPWDMAAGTLIVREAGGRVTDYTGGPLDLDGKKILGSNGLLHQEMMDVIEGRPGD